jgi:hypothetical protein
MLGNKKKLTDMLKSSRTPNLCPVCRSFFEICIHRRTDSRGIVRPNEILQGDVKTVVHGGWEVPLWRRRTPWGILNGKTYPGRAIFRRYCEGDINGEALA